ncbi:hypothetical protein C5L31_001445 [Secundilactobacillus malefermentans]|uniref:Lysozyme n=1 Tax=Secundilactobacillus malefermentans TaxID=176292 RepID=A0A4R5NNZ1_9LACO|nr:GH25 family lysozyme [Secundilactobacillus malefermentans]KRM60214.1 glycoside hydrolase family protein [Secundilactobacillus malefermentans DSM 5705 = KCTC 3548]TDG78259.1 hypothetical protein C5L31_001445 [Secundilactobacillus malefermentans]
MGKKVQPIYESTYRHRSTRRRTRILTVLILLIILIGGFWLFQKHQNKQLSHYPVKGVTLSQDDGYIDFHQLAQKGVKFTYLRASSGASFIDDQFSNSFSQFQGTDLKIGVYHMFSFSSSASAQYVNFRRAIGKSDGVLPIALQVSYYGSYSENSINQSAQQVKLKKLANLISTHYQRSVVIWTTDSIWHTWVKASVPKAAFWMADGKLKRTNDRMPFIEYNPKGKMTLSGSEQQVSQSVFTGNQKQWRNYLNAITNTK